MGKRKPSSQANVIRASCMHTVEGAPESVCFELGLLPTTASPHAWPLVDHQTNCTHRFLVPCIVRRIYVRPCGRVVIPPATAVSITNRTNNSGSPKGLQVIEVHLPQSLDSALQYSQNGTLRDILIDQQLFKDQA